MTSAILKKTEQFDSKLVNYSRTNEVFELEKPVVELTFDIIGIVALDEDLHAQEVDEKKSPLIKAFLGILGTYSGTLLLDYLPWERIPRAYYSQ